MLLRWSDYKFIYASILLHLIVIVWDFFDFFWNQNSGPAPPTQYLEETLSNLQQARVRLATYLL